MCTMHCVYHLASYLSKPQTRVESSLLKLLLNKVVVIQAKHEIPKNVYQPNLMLHFDQFTGMVVGK